MKRLLVLVIVLLMMIQTGIAEGEMDYRAIGSPARIFGTENGAVMTLLPGDESSVLCTVPERDGILVIGETADGFVLVNYQGQWGYVYWEYIDMMSSVGDISARNAMIGDDLSKVNGFITGFTRAQLAGSETGSGTGIAAAPESCAEKFAAQQLWLAGAECVEEGEFDDGNDIRISAEAVADFAAGYFENDVLSTSAGDDFCYYNSSEFAAGPFAIVTNISDIQDGIFAVKFNTYGMGSDWNEECAALTAEAAAEMYPENIGFGYAIISATEFADQDGYRLVDMIVRY